MTTESIIIYSFAIVASIALPIVMHTLKKLESHLPASMQAMLEQYARMAVLAVEQNPIMPIPTGTVITGAQKKEMALEIIKDLFLAAKLPLPNMAILSAAIEMAVYLLNQEQIAMPPAPTTTQTKS